MTFDLTGATVASLGQIVFGHSPMNDDGEPWHFGDVDFVVDPDRQLHLIAELFAGAPAIFASYDARQVEEGLWCMMGPSHSERFTGLVWNPDLPLGARRAVVESVYTLYDRVLAAYPYDEIDFRHPDASDRRFFTIDYMAPDLLLHAPWFRREDRDDHAEMRAAFLELFRRLLAHDAPVAQYAALHGLGHLDHGGRRDVIDCFLAAHGWLDPAVRAYAEAARRGGVL